MKITKIEIKERRYTMRNGIQIPAGLEKIFNIVKGLDRESQEQVLRSASIYAYGRASGRTADYSEGFADGYAKAKAELSAHA